MSLFGNIFVFLVPAAFPVDECPTISIDDEEEEEVCSFVPFIIVMLFLKQISWYL